MSWLFGKGKKKPQTDTPEMASEKLTKTIEDLQKRDDFFTKRINDETLNAKKFLKAGNRKKAAECIKRKKNLEAQQTKIMQMINNLETQKMQIQNAAINAQVFEQYLNTNTVIKNQFKDLDPDKIADAIDDMEETQATMDEISDALTRPMGPQVDEDEIDDELLALEGELEDGEEAEEVAAAPSHAGPAKVAVPAGGGGGAADEDEINGLMASFS
ncbi:Charged multivesicular body protein 4a [Tritrichomonas foetus]|uniref:Charged multivesicular body protein 4a n=1 Tax=Tritrichomonas foetus TaxID=1144522 RepID=A0A1J4KSE7_9EUKA|nr:Charged multivesicular body protein 4a [Tritrichomonas foetus]|eukprot:OHT14026.1 Charged multivesicular body protein 4a [Tritrichomonas foetus]